MNRTRDWRRAKTRTVWARRDEMAETVGMVTVSGTRRKASPVWRETPCRCSCVLCQWARKRRAADSGPTHAELWRMAAEEGRQWSVPVETEDADVEVLDCGRDTDAADRGCTVGSGVRLRGQAVEDAR